jgi:hypothetical protein
MTTPTQGEHAQTALEDFEVRKLAAIGAVSTSSGLVERRPIEYRRELENQFVRGYRAAESRLHAQVAALTAQPAAPQGVAYAELPEFPAGLCTVDDGPLSVIPGARAEHEEDGYSADQMRDFADRTHALRASNGQAPAGVVQSDRIDRGTVCANCGEVYGEHFTVGKRCPGKNGYSFAAPTAQAAPALAENGHLTQAGHDLLMEATLAGATLVSKGRLVGDMAQAAPAAERENLELRRMLCIAHAGAAAYMDDGEAQDNRELPLIDFLHDTPAEIQDKLQRRALKKLAAQAAAPTPAAHADSVLEDAALSTDDAALLEKAIADFDECGETDVPDADLRRFAAAGYLECIHYHVMPSAQEAIDAARKQGGA